MPAVRTLVCALSCALWGAFAIPVAHAQDYPNRPVKFIIPFGAGGPADVFTRQLSQHLSEQLKQPFIVETRPGAGAIIGTDAAAKSAPDGYTLLLMANAHTTTETLIPNRPYNLMRDFVAVAGLNVSDLLMVVHPSVPANDIREFVAYAKANPGKVNYASSGQGSPYHMAGELFKTMTGVTMQHVPYRGSTQARVDVIGGQVQAMFDAITVMTQNVRAGQVRALGTTGPKRTAVMPDVPAIAESLPGYDATIWLGIMAPTGTPPAIVDRLNVEINKVLSRPDIREAWAKQGAEPMVMTPAEFDAFTRRDIEKWAQVVKASGMKVE